MRYLLAAMIALTSTALPARPAAALEPHLEPSPTFSDVELDLELGWMDRGTTGVGEPLLGYGYDHAVAPLVGASARLFFHDSIRYFRHGIALRGAYAAGGHLGLGDGVEFHLGQVDLGYVFRTQLPCMSTDERVFHLSGSLGLTGVRADAGTGRGSRDDRWNQRLAAAEDLDHVGLGGFLAVDLALHVGPLITGIRIDVREHFAVTDGPVSRDFAVATGLRMGVDLEL